MSVKRRDFVIQVLRQMKLPYGWGQKGYTLLEAQKLGLAKPLYDARDCSGVQTFAYWRAGGPDLRGIGNAEYLLEKLSAPAMVRSGTLLLFGTKADPALGSAAHADHVMCWVEPGILVGADGGGSSTTTLDEALRIGAGVHAESAVGYMESRFLGYREFPFDD